MIMRKMNFKGWSILLSVILITILPFGCSDSDNKTDEPVGPVNEVFEVKDLTEFLFTQETGTVTMSLSANLSWTAVTTANWCTLSKISGNENEDIVVSVTANTSTEERRCQVILKGGTRKLTFDVVQLGESIQTIVYVNGVEIPDGEDANRVVVDFEQNQYRLHILSNMDYNVTFMSKNWFQYREADAGGYSFVEDYERLYDFLVADNEGAKRETSFTIAQKMGDYTRTVTIEQSPCVDFVRLFCDTVYLGSHYNVMEIQARTNISWEYEVVGNPDWVSEWRTRNMPGNTGTYALGVRSHLLADVQKNDKHTSRQFDLKIKYVSGGENKEQIVKVIQLPNNPVASDSLVLMDLVRYNSNEKVGLQVGWAMGQPVTSWSNVRFTTMPNGEQRMTGLIIAAGLVTHELTASIGNLTELKELNLSKNYLYGPLPEEMSRLTNLEILDLSTNLEEEPDNSPSLTKTGIEEIPAVIFEKCILLKELDISVNRLRTIPESIKNLAILEKFTCGIQPEMNEFPVEAFRKLTHMRELEISDIRLWEGDFFDFIFDMPYLEKISFFRMNFNDNAMTDRFETLSELRDFTCQSSKIGGTFPKSLLQCQNLETLAIGDNHLSGELPVNLPDLKKLYSVDFSDNNFTGTIPESYAEFGNDVGASSSRGTYTNLFLMGNRLSGKIPEVVKSSKMWSPKRWEPETFICPQQDTYGFENCSSQE